jgi:hypothetical protein
MKEDGFGDVGSRFLGPVFQETSDYMKQCRDDGVLDMEEYSEAEKEVMSAALPPMKTMIVTAQNIKEAVKGYDPSLN